MRRETNTTSGSSLGFRKLYCLKSIPWNFEMGKLGWKREHALNWPLIWILLRCWWWARRLSWLSVVILRYLYGMVGWSFFSLSVYKSLVVEVEYLFTVMLLKLLFFFLKQILQQTYHFKKLLRFWHDFSQACVMRKQECHIGLGIWKLCRKKDDRIF